MTAAETLTAGIDSRLLRTIAFIEGTTLVALVFLGMPLKHLFGIGMPNMILGPTHGVAFIAYAAAMLVAVVIYRRSFEWLVMAMLASIIPGGTFWFFAKPAASEASAAR